MNITCGLESRCSSSDMVHPTKLLPKVSLGNKARLNSGGAIPQWVELIGEVSGSKCSDVVEATLPRPRPHDGHAHPSAAGHDGPKLCPTPGIAFTLLELPQPSSCALQGAACI